MRKLNRKQAFTLIEILSAVLIIAFLATFVVPKVGTVKDTAKTAGVDSNARIVKAYLDGVISQYSKDEVVLLEKELAESFSGEERLKNPYTKEIAVLEVNNLNTNKGAAVVYSNLDNSKTNIEAIVQYFTSVEYKTLRGAVGVAAYPSPDGTDSLEAVIVPFDKKGKVVKSKVIVVKP